MALSSSIQFIDTALFCTSPFALSYTDSNQKLVIRKHLLSLVQDYPSFIPSNDSFTHNDGTTINLLNASGYLHVSHSTSPIHLTVWIHENYPFMPPMVFISSNSKNPIHHNHPFVDSSGAVTSAYLQTWSYPGHNLSELVHNLGKIFSHDHPFSSSSSNSSFTHPSLVSKREALDRLSGMLHYDMIALQTKTAEEIEELSILQIEMEKRADAIKNTVTALEQERKNLKERVTELADKADVLSNWLKVNDPKSVEVISGNFELEDAFEAVGEESNIVLDGWVADGAIEDVIYALDKALEQGVMNFDTYIRNVRILAREQFFQRDSLVKLKGPDILI